MCISKISQIGLMRVDTTANRNRPKQVTTNQNSLFRPRDWLSANQGPVFHDSVGSWCQTTESQFLCTEERDSLGQIRSVSVLRTVSSPHTVDPCTPFEEAIPYVQVQKVPLELYLKYHILVTRHKSHHHIPERRTS
eukprot:sb/3474620/